MQIESHPERLLGRVPEAFGRAVFDVEREAKRNAPVGITGGDFRRRIRTEWLGPLQARVGTDHPGGRIREFGGTIVAKTKKYLHFYDKRHGTWVMKRQVTQRPGGYSQGFRPWLRPAGGRFGEFFVKHLRGRP